MLQSEKSRKENPEIDPLLLGSGWTPEDLGKPQVLLESAYGDSHPGSRHLKQLKKMAFLKGLPFILKITKSNRKKSNGN